MLSLFLPVNSSTSRFFPVEMMNSGSYASEIPGFADGIALSCCFNKLFAAVAMTWTISGGSFSQGFSWWNDNFCWLNLKFCWSNHNFMSRFLVTKTTMPSNAILINEASMKRCNSVDVACAECGATIRAGQGVFPWWSRHVKTNNGVSRNGGPHMDGW